MAYEPLIEDNNFQGFTHGGQNANHENLGTVTDNSFERDKSIYRNTFLNLSRASYARGINSDAYMYFNSFPTGLRYICNTYDDNVYDIQVQSLDMFATTVFQSIAYNQGSTFKSAGNQFLDRSDITHLLNTSTGLFSYYHTTGNYLPILHTNPAWNAIALKQISGSYAHTCASNYPTNTTGRTFPLASGDVGTAKAAFHDNETERQELTTTYDGLIDGGNTGSLLSYIAGSTATDSPTVRTTLLGYSPYLTIPVLTAIADAGILTQSVLIDILEANPEMLRDENLLEHLDNDIPNPLNSTQIDDLRALSLTATVRTDIESEIAHYRMEKSYAATLILNHYLLDTADYDRDSIPVWLDHINTLAAAYQKVAYYTGLEDYTTAESILDDIPTDFTLNDDQEAEYDLYVELWELLKSIHDDDRTPKEMTSGEILELEAIGETPAATGRLIGTQVDVIGNEPTPNFKIACNFTEGPMEKPGKRTIDNQSQESYRKQQAMSKNNLVKAYPNPAKDFVVFEYRLSNTTSTLTLSITNTTGQKIKEILLNGQTGKAQWETQSIPSGVYIYELSDSGKPVDVGRIVITK